MNSVSCSITDIFQDEAGERLHDCTFSPPTDMDTDFSMLMNDIINNSLLTSDVSFNEPAVFVLFYL